MHLVSRILTLLKHNDGLTDRQITERLHMLRPQGVNSTMRRLCRLGVIRRVKKETGATRNFRGKPFESDRCELISAPTKVGKGTRSTNRMRAKRQTPEWKQWRMRVLELIDKADLDVACSIKRDLSRRIEDPFYGEKIPTVPSRSNVELLIAYAKLLERVHDDTFRKNLARAMSSHQQCLLKKFARRIGPKAADGQIMEHAIPTKFMADEMLRLIELGKLAALPALFDIYRKAGQRALSKQHDAILTSMGLKDSMPRGWLWQRNGADYLARYRVAGVIEHVFLEEHER